MDLIFTHIKSAYIKELPELEKMMGLLGKGDTEVVWKFERLRPSLRHLIDLPKGFEEKKVQSISLQAT